MPLQPSGIHNIEPGELEEPKSAYNAIFARKTNLLESKTRSQLVLHSLQAPEWVDADIVPLHP